jgi:hypothetical protein
MICLRLLTTPYILCVSFVEKQSWALKPACVYLKTSHLKQDLHCLLRDVRFLPYYL